MKIMTSINSFEDLEVWQKAHGFVLKIYETVEQYPSSEQYKLTNQITRAAVSIPTNIAEGKGRYSIKELIQFLVIARGSAEECKYLLILSRDLRYITADTYDLLRNDIEAIGKMLNGLISKLRP